ncbi:MAG: GGDEF domain-containing protein [Gammaproteobacteria bacterium]|nr:GGDEF domain-containing protein [Gammaproteobacteria bacterium]
MPALADQYIIHCIVIDSSTSSGEEIINQLSKTGLTLEYRVAHNSETILEVLEQDTNWDVILFSLRTTSINLRQFSDILKQQKQSMPVIAIADHYQRELAEQYLTSTAHDLVGRSEISLLRRSIIRELAYYKTKNENRRLGQLVGSTEQNFEDLLALNPDPIAYIHDGIIVKANTAFAQVVEQKTNDDVLHFPLLDFFPKESQLALRHAIRQCEDQSALELSLEHDNKNIQLQLANTHIKNEKCIRLHVTNQNETPEATTTNSVITLIKDIQSREHQLESIAFIEIDQFNKILHRLGTIGTQLLLDQLTEIFEQAEPVIRCYVLNQIIVLTMNLPKGRAHGFCKSIITQLSNHIFTINNRKLQLTVSIGLSTVNAKAQANESLHQADIALNAARADGGNKSIIYHSSLEQNKSSRQVDLPIDELFSDSELSLAYQPIVNLKASASEKYEVLLRRVVNNQHETLPETFWQQIKQSKQAEKIDLWVIEQAVKRLQKEQSEERNLCFFIKLSNSSILNGTILPWLKAFLIKTPIIENSLVFEFKQDLVANSPHELRAFLAGLKDLGCLAAIEDINDDERIFEQLATLDITYLKIDGLYIRDLSRNRQHQKQLQKITEAARGLNKNIIAEFVQDADSLALLWQEGVNYIQGNYLQAPEADLRYDFSAQA